MNCKIDNGKRIIDMEYKKRISLLLLAGVCLWALVSCQDNKKEIEPILKKSRVQETELGTIITSGMEANPTEGFYILYDASFHEYTTLTEEEYALSVAFGNLLVRQEQELRAGDLPKGQGWIVGGKGKGKLQAIKIAYEIADKIEENKNFEIHVEYHEDGSFTVWYRMIK